LVGFGGGGGLRHVRYGFVTFVDAQSAMMVKSYGTIEFMNRQLNVGDAVRGMAGVMKGGRGGASADGASPSYERMATYGAPMQLTHGGYAMGYANFPGGYAMDMHGGQYPMAPYGVTYQQINYDGSPYGGPRFHPVRSTARAYRPDCPPYESGCTRGMEAKVGRQRRCSDEYALSTRSEVTN
jgi:hypothetical protein